MGTDQPPHLSTAAQRGASLASGVAGGAAKPSRDGHGSLGDFSYSQGLQDEGSAMLSYLTIGVLPSFRGLSHGSIKVTPLRAGSFTNQEMVVVNPSQQRAE